MAFTINHVVLVGGNLVRDAELKYLTSGTAKSSFDIAMNRSYTDKSSGELVEETSYFKVIIWGKIAESLTDFLKKGQKVAIEGRLVQRRWTTDDNQTRSIVEIQANSVVLMGGKNDGENSKPYEAKQAQVNQGNPPQVTAQEGYGSNFSSDDVPF